MNEKRIDEIVQKVFDKAKKKNASHSKYALSSHIGEQIGLSSKTVERAYEKCIEKKDARAKLSAGTIDLLCIYLDYKNYRSYVEDNPEDDVQKPVGQKRKDGEGKKTEKLGGEEEKKRRRRIFTISISVAFGMMCVFIGVQNYPTYFSNKDPQNDGCMTWADSLYVEVSCDTGPLSKFGTEVKPLDKVELKSMRKVQVTAAYDFFGPTGKPLIWYYKNKANEIEYFTAPGLHPVNRETLKKITPYIIETYVPVHGFNENSFMNHTMEKE